MLILLFSCNKYPEMTLSEIEAARAAGANELVEKTVSKPNTTNKFVVGKAGGTWNDSIMGDPKSFNLLVAEKDGTVKKGLRLRFASERVQEEAKTAGTGTAAGTRGRAARKTEDGPEQRGTV